MKAGETPAFLFASKQLFGDLARIPQKWIPVLRQEYAQVVD
jgi:hypothetical protein